MPSLVVWFLMYMIPDIMTFHEVTNSNYITPWYDTSWVQSPYTNFRLHGKPYKEYWTKNATGEDWFIRDIYFDGKHTFWTIIKRGKGLNI